MKTLTEEQIKTLKTMDWQDDRGEDTTGALLYFTNTNDSYFQDITGVCVSCLRELLGGNNTMEIFYWEIAYRFHKDSNFYDLHYAIWCKSDVVKDGIIQEFDTDILGLFTEKTDENTAQNDFGVLKNTLETILEKYDTETVAEFLDNNFADIPNSIREKCVENLDVEDLGECLIEDAAHKWIEENPGDAYERAMRDMSSYDIKDKIIDYLSDNL